MCHWKKNYQRHQEVWRRPAAEVTVAVMEESEAAAQGAAEPALLGPMVPRR